LYYVFFGIGFQGEFLSLFSFFFFPGDHLLLGSRMLLLIFCAINRSSLALSR
jgi:hypothetical protein